MRERERERERETEREVFLEMINEIALRKDLPRIS